MTDYHHQLRLLRLPSGRFLHLAIFLRAPGKAEGRYYEQQCCYRQNMLSHSLLLE